MNKKAKELSDWYLELSQNDNGIETIAALDSPNMSSNLDMYRINPPKPVKKVIDLSCIVGSDIDCEFENYAGIWVISNLKEISNDSVLEYRGNLGYLADKCRIRQGKWMSWQGGDKPIPEGLNVQFRMIDSGELTGYITPYYQKGAPVIDWNEVIAFKVIGPAEGFKYEWEDDNDNQ